MATKKDYYLLGLKEGREAATASTRIWEYEGADGVWHECRNADDACMWAEDGRRIREANPLGVVELDGFNMIEAKDEDHSQSRTVGGFTRENGHGRLFH